MCCFEVKYCCCKFSIMVFQIIVVSYEIHDYRNEKRRDKSDRETDKIKWLNIEREPTAFEILCFMTCFLALFTGKSVSISKWCFKWKALVLREFLVQMQRLLSYATRKSGASPREHRCHVIIRSFLVNLLKNVFTREHGSSICRAPTNGPIRGSGYCGGGGPALCAYLL